MLKDKKTIDQKAVIFVVAILLASAFTYWLVARPYIATRDCQKIALDNTGYQKDSWQSWAGNRTNQANYMFIYEMCMQKEGIDPR